ncbi:hypothetical protein [Fusobacterium mortiferum]|uniref:hypothetical protein n=1 Tax=Fusobacterium mortiferum TaxID=850 RepID=UPI0019584CB0|nr:hypothetical protein [Fusobacterium mortiferum]
MANKSNYFPRRSSHFKNYKVILSGRGSLVIPEIKISDRGLFDVKKFEFIKLDVEGV